MISLNQLRYFETICRSGSFSKAAEILDISQPAISSAMRELEAECGTKLFTRNKSAAELTDEGHVFLGIVEPLLQQYRDLNDVVHSFALSRNFVRIGFTTVLGSQVASDLLTRFHRSCPDIQVFTEEGSYRTLWSKLTSGALDLVIASIPDAVLGDVPNTHALPLMSGGLKFCVSTQHPFAWRKSITWEEIAQVPLILPNERFSHAKRILEKIASRGLQPIILHRTDQIYTIERFIENNAAGGFLPRSAAIRNRYITALDIEDNVPQNAINLFWISRSYLYHSVEKFIECAREYSKENQNLI